MDMTITEYVEYLRHLVEQAEAEMPNLFDEA